ncbi:MAG: hypothetical protein J6Z34_06590 [Clostridia bacterium]|nr:hypothetical protein [Clostridia bacterium]
MRNVKRINYLSYIAAGVILALALAGSFTLGFFARQWSLSETARDTLNVLEVIEKNYVGDFDADEFIRSAVNGSLDRYSAYYTPVEYDEVNLHRSGISQGRVGINFYGGSNVIYSVTGNSPAERSGITEGGAVVGIKLSEEADYTPVSVYSDFAAVYDTAQKGEAMYLLINYGGTAASFVTSKDDFIESYVWYQNSAESYNFEYNNGKWELAEREKPLKSHVNEGYAYIKLSSFNGAAAVQTEMALEKMRSDGIKKLVLDLRNNGGGYMDILVEIAGRLIPGNDKQVVSSVVYKSGAKYEFSTNNNHYGKYGFEKIVLLGNENTASASEALIGAVLDYDSFYGKNIARVIVSGNAAGSFRTYGKGIMQTTFELSGGRAIKLTTAKIYWPTSGNCIHGKGVTPEIDARVTGVMPVTGADAELEAAMN